ncbi:MAG: hypothetical protein HC908_05310 [Calothrix sp. SM1_7_51]|nr:hypothetical protein [Calothrix sp. SM1_7_51]
MLEISTSSNFVVSPEELFTELTPEEGAIIEGGKSVLIRKIQAIKAGADTFSADDTYITIGGKKVWGEKSMTTGQSREVYERRYFNGSTRVALFDEDLGRDDQLGSFTVSGATNGTAIARVSGSGSSYDVYYQVFA